MKKICNLDLKIKMTDSDGSVICMKENIVNEEPKESIKSVSARVISLCDGNLKQCELELKGSITTDDSQRNITSVRTIDIHDTINYDNCLSIFESVTSILDSYKL